MKKYSIYIGGLFGMTLWSACNTPKLITEPTAKELPKEFVIPNHDTTFNIQQVTVDNFFADDNLKRHILKAKSDNLDYAIVLKRLEIAHLHLKKAKLLNLPSLNASANASGTQFGKYTMEGVGNFDTNLSQNIDDDQKVKTNPVPNYFLGLTANWEVDLWGKFKNMKKAAQNRYWASMEGKRLLESLLVTQVANVYYDLIALDQEIDILNSNIELQTNALEVVQLHHEVGRATKLAVIQTEAQLNNSKSLLKLKQQDLQEAEMAMQALIGEYEGSVVRSKTIDIKAVQMLSANAIPSQVMRYRPDVLQAYYNLEASRADAKAVRAAFYPTLTLNAYGAYNAFSGEMLFNPKSMAWQLLGGLTAPIFNKGQIKNDFKIANNEQEIAFLEYQKTAMDAYREVNNTLKNIENTNDAYVYKKSEVDMMKEGVVISNDLYLTGYATYLEIIAAQKSKLEADLQLIELKKRQVKNYILLYKSLGGGYNN